MNWPDEKTIAILALLVIALAVIFATGQKGLDVVTNVVCGISGLVAGAMMTSK